MKIDKTKLKGVFLIKPDLFQDSRGWFLESYSQKKIQKAGLKVKFIQDNVSFSKKKGTLRGLHWQEGIKAQAKLVSCSKGAVLDIAVDLRKNSSSYKKWIAVKLTDKNKKQLFIPRGFAHGFLTLKDNTEFRYKVDNYYAPEAESHLRYDDPEIKIKWGIKKPFLSKKDLSAPFLKDIKNKKL